VCCYFVVVVVDVVVAGEALSPGVLDVVVVVEPGLSAGLVLSPHATMLETAPAITRTARMVSFFIGSS